MSEMWTAREDNFLRKLRTLFSKALAEPIPGVSDETARVVMARITTLAERETELDQSAQVTAPRQARPAPVVGERRGPYRSSMDHISLLRDINPAALEKLLSNCAFRDLASGEVLLTAEHSNQKIYVIMSGSVRVHLDDLSGPPYVEISVGECVGEVSLFGKTKVTAHVLGSEPARLMVIDQDLLWQLIADSPELARNLLYTLSRRVGRDNTQLRKSLHKQRESEIHANLDPLTGLANRRSLNAFFSTCIDECTQDGAPLSLLMMDIDHFKRFNDTYGHVMGDEVLCAVASILSERVDQGLAARYGGEEFALVLPGYEMQQAYDLATTLRLKTREIQLYSVDDGKLIPPITISAGVAEMNAGDTPQSLILAADSALYAAKRNGRDCVMTFGATQPTPSRRRSEDQV